MHSTVIYIRSNKMIHTQCNREQFKRNALDAISGFAGVWDVFKAMELLHPLTIIDTESRQQILKRCSEIASSRQKISTLITILFEKESLEVILKVLDVVGLSKIADEICRPLNRPIRRTDLPHSRHLQTFYFHLKINIDNGNFLDRGEYLQSLSNRLESSFNLLNNEHDLTKATGRYAIVTWLRIQHCNRDTKLIRDVLRGMYATWPNGIDKSLCEIFFHSKMAVAAAMDGDIASALSESQTAKHLSASFHDPLTKALNSHDRRYTNQRVFLLNRSEENRELILVESENGLDLLSSNYNGCDLFTRLMNRMFLLYLAQYHLKIENDLSIAEQDEISQYDLKNAENALFCFNKMLEPHEQIYQNVERVYLMYKAKEQARKVDLEQSENTLQRMQDPDGQQQTCDVKREASGMEMDSNMKQFSNKFLPETVIDPRRAMVYLVCRARIYERKHKFEMAEFLLCQACELAQEGAHYTNEKRNIRTFLNRLLVRS